MSHMHILFITPSFDHKYNPLTSIFFEDQVAALQTTAGNSIGVISVNLISIKDLFKNNRKILKGSSSKNVNAYIYYFVSIPKLPRINHFVRTQLGKILFKKYIRENNLPDIIHVQQFNVGNLAVWIKETYKIPFVITEHSSIFARNLAKNWEFEIAKNVYKKSCKNICVSEEFSKYLSSHFDVIFSFIPNVVDTEYFTPLRTINATFTFLNIGSLDENKNQILLIRSFNEAFRNNFQFRLIIAGDGAQRKLLDATIQELSLDKQITLLGEVTRSQVRELLQSSDCFVLSSKYETFGIVLIEAMSCGLPAISTKCGGPLSIITNEKLGILCEFSLKEFSDAMKQVTKREYNPEYIRSHCLHNYSLNKIGERIVEIYKTSLK